MTLVKPIPKLLLPPIRTAQLTKLSEFVAIAHNLPISQDKSCTQGATGFDFACHWFNLNWHKIFSQSLSVAIALLCYYFQRSFENCSNRG